MILQRRFVLILAVIFASNYCWIAFKNNKSQSKWLTDRIRRLTTISYTKFQENMNKTDLSGTRVISPSSQITEKTAPKHKEKQIANTIKLDNMTIQLDVNCSSPAEMNPYCLHYNFTRLLSPKWECDGNMSLLMMVTSVPWNMERRSLLRKTWCSDFTSKHGNVQHIFLFGRTKSVQEQKELEKEAAAHGDILQDDFVEDYRNMTIKTIMAFRWFHEHCSNVSYLMKCDDDMFINTIELLLMLMRNVNRFQNALFGRCYETSRTLRNPKVRWYVSHAQFNESHFPPYCAGTGYVLGSSIAHKVAGLMPSVPIFPIEDAYIGLCVKYLKGNVITLKGFNHHQRVTPFPKLKILNNNHKLFTVHKANNSDVNTLWEQALHVSSFKIDIKSDD